MRDCLLSCSLLFLFLPSLVPAQVPSGSKPNIVLITVDTTRADRMGFLGSHRGLTPNLDAVAGQAFVFSRAYCQVPITVPSHVSLLTGTYPQFNHVNDFGGPITKDLPYLPDQLHQNGYKTAAFVGSIVLDPKSGTAPGIDRGFDAYDAGFAPKHVNENRFDTIERRAEDVVGHTIAWLKKRPEGRFFLWVHLYDPHAPYDAPEPFRSRFSDPYDAEIAYADAMLGRLFTEMRAEGIYDGSLIAVMSDHGEAFGEHGEVLHGIFLYDETIHVPLLIKLPAGARSTPGERMPGEHIDARVGLIDVAPTILDLAGVAVPGTMQGKSLLPVMENPAARNSDRPVYSESDYPHISFGWSSLRALRTGKYLYVEAPKRELYDQTGDPGEAKNLAQSSPAIADTLNAQLEALRKNTASGIPATAKLDPDLSSKLAALGYASGSGSSGESAVGGIDPKDHIEISNLFHNGLRAIDEGDPETGVKDLERVIQAQPELATFKTYDNLGNAYMSLKQYDKAIPVLRKAVELKPDSAVVQHRLGLAFFETGKIGESITAFELAVKAAPDWADGLYSLATAYLRANRRSDTLATVDRALKVDPQNFHANLLRGYLLLEERPSEALVNLQRAAEKTPSASEPHRFMARAYKSIGNTEKAAEEQQKAQQLRTAPF